MDINEWKAKRFQEALDRLLDTDVAGMFKGIHRSNELLEEHKIKNPMPPQTLLDLGIAIGSIQLMQECRPVKGLIHE